jgi:hypothetical protein
MTNQEYMCLLSAPEFVVVLDWLKNDYGRRYTDTNLAIEKWLQETHIKNEPELQKMLDFVKVYKR